MKYFVWPLAILFSLVLSFPAHAEPVTTSESLTLYGDAKYKPGFTHFEYANPDAPKGGELKLADMGAFDSLNFYIIKGVKAPGLPLIHESLMTQSLDEPQSMYGLVAESVTLPASRRWAEFTLRENARWHDGKPITPDDIIWSVETLKTKADPVYRILYTPIAKVEKTGPRRVKFTFADTGGNSRELPLIAASVPILPKHFYCSSPPSPLAGEGQGGGGRSTPNSTPPHPNPPPQGGRESCVDFEKASLTPPLGSGPYKIAAVDAGRSIAYERVKNYWGANLPTRRGHFNFDRIRYDIYHDETVQLEALKAGEYDFRQEFIARNWATAYTSPAIDQGRLIKRAIPHKNPQGMQAFLFNVRKSRFADRRVREAFDLAMDYEWLNRTIFYGAYTRNRSFFENTEFEAKGVPTGDELKLLEPFKPSPPGRGLGEGISASVPSPHPGPLPGGEGAEFLPPTLFTQEYANPKTDGSGNNRPNLITADKLLKDAGWVVKNGKRVNAITGEPLTIEFLLRQATFLRVLGAMRKGLDRLGIDSSVRLVDDAQYQRRVNEWDFDMISIWINQGAFYPGAEQKSYWHSSQADVKGSNNPGGIKNPVVDALLAKLLSARDLGELRAAGRALDRVLQWEHYVIPHWHSSAFRVAYWNKFGMPKISPLYDNGLMTWWVKKDSMQ